MDGLREYSNDSGRSESVFSRGEARSGSLESREKVALRKLTMTWANLPTALGARNGVWYEKREPSSIHCAAPPRGVLGARWLVCEPKPTNFVDRLHGFVPLNGTPDTGKLGLREETQIDEATAPIRRRVQRHAERLRSRRSKVFIGLMFRWSLWGIMGPVLHDSWPKGADKAFWLNGHADVGKDVMLTLSARIWGLAQTHKPPYAIGKSRVSATIIGPHDWALMH